MGKEREERGAVEDSPGEERQVKSKGETSQPDLPEGWKWIVKKEPCSGELVRVKVPKEEAEQQRQHLTTPKQT